MTGKKDDGFSGEPMFQIQGTNTLTDEMRIATSEVKPKTPRRYCQHRLWIVDPDTRTVACGAEECGVALDPFDLLMEYANRERRFVDWEGRAREIGKQVDALKAEEKKIKSRTKAASRKDANAAVNDERRKEAARRDYIRGFASEIARLADSIQRHLPKSEDPKHEYSDTCECPRCKRERDDAEWRASKEQCT